VGSKNVLCAVWFCFKRACVASQQLLFDVARNWRALWQRAKKSTESVCGNFVICWGKRILLELAWARADVSFLIERCQQIMLSNRLILSAGLRFILFNQVLTECSSANRYDCIQFKCNRGRNLYPQQCYTFPCSCCILKLVEYNIFVFLGTI
jgi:hypothetical protein